MKILITGINGFVGSNLTESLKADHSIWGIDIVPVNKDGILGSFNWNQFDQLPEVDAFIHLAGKAHDTKNTSLDEEYFAVNVGLTQKVFDYFLRSKAKKFIYFSSVKAVADNVDTVLTEDEQPNPQTPYGKSKLEAEKYIQMQAIAPEKQVYILRPAMIHGPGNKGNLNLLYNLIQKGIPYPLGAFKNQRSFTSIGNISFIVDQLLKKNVESGIFQVADDTPLSTVDIVNLMADATGKKTPIWELPVGLIKFIAKTGDILKIRYNSEKLQKLTENYIVSNSKIKRALGVELPISSRQGLIHTLSSFQTKITTHKN
jgi:nucleoside-diphosphate-sugar epimerase